MTPEQAAALKVGDVIHVRMSVVRANVPETRGMTTYAKGTALADAWTVAVDPSEIVSVEPRPLAVGDRVRLLGGGVGHKPGTLLAIDDEEAWVRWDSGTRCTYFLSNLERVP